MIRRSTLLPITPARTCAVSDRHVQHVLEGLSLIKQRRHRQSQLAAGRHLRLARLDLVVAGRRPFTLWHHGKQQHYMHCMQGIAVMPAADSACMTAFPLYAPQTPSWCPR